MNVCNSICVFPCELQNSITRHRHFFILGGCVYGINEDVFAKRQFCFSSVRLDFDISAKKTAQRTLLSFMGHPTNQTTRS